MEVNKILEFIESFRDMAIVRFVAGFYREGMLKPVFNWLDSVSEAPGQAAKTLLIWALVLAAVVFAVDQIMYFTAPGRIDEWRARIYAFIQRVKQLFNGTSGRKQA